MIVISDTSPIINLAIIDKLDLLPQLFDTIVIPEAVFNEIVIIGKGLPGSDIIENAKWVEVKTCNNRILINSLLDYVQIGEAEALTLALELQADTIIVDEAAARNLAEQFGLNFTGLLGILIKAKEHGLIPSVKPLMDALRTKARFFIHQSLYNQVLKIAKEEA